MHLEEICDILNSIVYLGSSSTTDAGSLTIFSDDGTLDDTVTTNDDKEEDNVTYHHGGEQFASLEPDHQR